MFWLPQIGQCGNPFVESRRRSSGNRNAATQVKVLINKYGNPAELPQTEESGVLYNLLQDLKTLPQENRTKIA